MTPEFLQISNELKAAREAAGYSVEKLASLTRIDKKFIESIESGNFTFLAEVYVKAFIRTISKTLALDEQLMMKKFNLAKEGKSPELAAVAEPPQPKEIQEPFPKSNLKPIVENPMMQEAVSPRRTEYSDYPPELPEETKKPGLNPLYLFVAGLAVVTLLAFYYFFIREESIIIVEETPDESEIVTEQPRYEEIPPAQGVETTAAGDSLLLGFVAKDSVWMKVVMDDSVNKEFYMRPGNKMEVKAQNSFSVLLGNLMGVEMNYNSNPVELEMTGKRVVRISFDRQGYRIVN